MAQEKQDQEAQEHGVKGMNWRNHVQELGDAINMASVEGSETFLSACDEKKVKQHLDMASQHHAAAKENPDKTDEHVKDGFSQLDSARRIIRTGAKEPRLGDYLSHMT